MPLAALSTVTKPMLRDTKKRWGREDAGVATEGVSGGAPEPREGQASGASPATRGYVKTKEDPVQM